MLPKKDSKLARAKKESILASRRAILPRRRYMKLWGRRAEKLLMGIPATEYPMILEETEKLCAAARRKSGIDPLPPDRTTWWLNRPGR